jgi:heterodisulfide reductase subunit A
VLFALTEEGRGDGPLGWIELLKLGERLRHVAPDISVTFAGGPDQPLGQGTDLAASLRAAGGRFRPGALTWVLKAPGPRGGIIARLEDGEATETQDADLLVVYQASEPSEGAAELARHLHLRPRPDGFFEDRVGPFETACSGIEGIYVAGGAGGPRTIAAAIQDGAAAAARILSKLIPGEKLTLECLVSEVDADRCGRCGICVSCCPFGAVGRGPDGGASKVEPALCRGCGTCAAACPSGAITARHFTSRQILVELGGLLSSEDRPEGG